MLCCPDVVCLADRKGRGRAGAAWEAQSGSASSEECVRSLFGPDSRDQNPADVLTSSALPVVAQLRMPFPLAPISLSNTTTTNTTSSLDSSASRQLTAEQLKDVVCTTAMFLFVREEWGGVGRRRR